jgi:DNA-binding response OmpR family regulator
MSLRVSVRPADVTNMASTCVKVVDYKIARSDIGVLLVEDDPESAGLTLTKVSEGKDSPFRVEWADDLQRAMSRLAQPGIDVVLLDFGMLESGHPTSHPTIKRVVSMKVPVVILTSDESTLSRHLTLGHGAVSYLIKRRTSSAELRHALHEAMALSR